MSKAELHELRLIAHHLPKSSAAEAYRTLRTNLGFAALDEPVKTLLITSAGPSDGKSTTAANLAIVLAQAGNRVLLIDCDLRKPMQHKLFGLSNQRGIMNCLLLGLDPDEASQESGEEKLRVLTSGPIPPNPAEILSSQKIADLFNLVKSRYDHIIIDSPPVLAVTDAVLLSTQVDGVMLVITSAKTKIDIARQAKNQLVRANARLLGVVLNRVNMENEDYQYYYYYYQHGGPESSRPSTFKRLTGMI